MDATHIPSPPDATSTDATVSLATAPAPAKRIGWIEGHLPDIVEPLDPHAPDTAFTETRRLRQDGWTPDRKRTFLSCLAECGVVKEACLAAGMSARAAYNLRDRDALFAAGWDAACVMARPRLADEVFSRSMNGVVDRIYRDGVVVAERHRYDNRLTMAVLARLDSRVDRAEQRGDPHLALVGRWDDFLDALGEDRRDDGLALLAPGPEPEPAARVHDSAGDRELREVHDRDEPAMPFDQHDVWEGDDGWRTNYPPPAGFDGDEDGEYEDGDDYSRTLSSEEQAVVDAEVAAVRARERALGEAQRRVHFFGGVSPKHQEAALSAAAPINSPPPQHRAPPSVLPPHEPSEAIMSTNTDTSKLDDLIHTVIDSIKGFERSAEDAPDGRFASFFRDMARERREVVTTLQAQSRALGGSPTDQGSAAGTLHRRWEDLRTALGGGDKAVIQEVERGEDYLKEEFERAMNDSNISEETRAVISSCYDSVRRGHDTARDLKRQLESAS